MVFWVLVWWVFVWFWGCLCSLPPHHVVFPSPSMMTWALRPHGVRTRGKKITRLPSQTLANYYYYGYPLCREEDRPYHQYGYITYTDDQWDRLCAWLSGDPTFRRKIERRKKELKEKMGGRRDDSDNRTKARRIAPPPGGSSSSSAARPYYRSRPPPPPPPHWWWQ